MNRRKGFAAVGFAGIVALAFLYASDDVRGQEKKLPGPQPWTLDEAIQQLSLYPRDAYLQYVALQLAQRENRTLEVTAQLQRVLGGNRPGGGGRGAGRSVQHLQWRVGGSGKPPAGYDAGRASR